MKAPILLTITRRCFSCTGSVLNKAGGAKGTPSVPKPQSSPPKATPVSQPKVTATAQASGPQLSGVKGLSSAVHGNVEPVGPGAARNAEYKVPEYFNYNKTSYFEAEIEMSKYRCPQPSARK